jgi:hypothetical protein
MVGVVTPMSRQSSQFPDQRSGLESQLDSEIYRNQLAMPMNTMNNAGTRFPHLRHVSVSEQQRSRKNHLSNIWVFDSPKNNRRFTVESDVAFMHFILLEGDTTVLRYDPNPEGVTVITDGESKQTIPDAAVYFKDGRTEWWKFGRSTSNRFDRTKNSHASSDASADEIASKNPPYKVVTEKELRYKQIQFENWLLLCAAITRVSQHFTFKEENFLRTQLKNHQELVVSSLLEANGNDPGLMLGVIAKLLQQGVLQTELEKKLFGLDSVLMSCSL